MKSATLLSGLLAAVAPSLVAACGEDGAPSCYGPRNNVEYVRQVKRMQPGAPNATYGPKGPLEWGQINFLHTVRAALFQFEQLKKDKRPRPS